MTNGKKRPSDFKEWLTLSFGYAEDVVYVGLGLLLMAIALSLLVTEMVYFGNYLLTRTLTDNVVFLLDRILLIIIFVEVMYTVQVSFRQHVLQPEPFLVVGLIAVTRRILVLTAEMPKLAKESQEGFYNSMIELGLLTVLIITLVLCLHILRRREQSKGERS
ncbi:MAG TPA: phosphate-starvation-inducible PsiE family protein [Candidatus Deferrimicrobium sp.]|nr:phosphate-starvation-inducible PsiE family protein [Candidatus Deferrimicrobium sp.]